LGRFLYHLTTALEANTSDFKQSLYISIWILGASLGTKQANYPVTVKNIRKC